MIIAAFQCPHRPGLREGKIVLHNEGSGLHKYVTHWQADYPAISGQYERSHGHYFGTLAEAWTDFQKRCAAFATAAYQGTYPQ